MTLVALSTFIRIGPNGREGRYHNGRVGQIIRLERQDFSHMSFLYAGAAKNRTGDNIEAGITMASNRLAISIARQAVEGKWPVEVVSCSMNPTTWQVGRVLTREIWVAASLSYDPSQVEVILSSAIDAVGAIAPTRTLTSKLVGSLPLTGQIQNL